MTEVEQLRNALRNQMRELYLPWLKEYGWPFTADKHSEEQWVLISNLILMIFARMVEV